MNHRLWLPLVVTSIYLWDELSKPRHKRSDWTIILGVALGLFALGYFATFTGTSSEYQQW